MRQAATRRGGEPARQGTGSAQQDTGPAQQGAGPAGWVRGLVVLGVAIALTAVLNVAFTYPEWRNYRPAAPVEVAAGGTGIIGTVEAAVVDVWARSTYPTGEPAPEGTVVLQATVRLEATGSDQPYCEPRFRIDDAVWQEYNDGVGAVPGQDVYGMSNTGCTWPWEADPAEPHEATWLFVVPEDAVAEARTAAVEIIDPTAFPAYLRLAVDPGSLH